MRTSACQIVLLTSALAGCATIVPKPGFETVSDLVSERSPGRAIAWNQGTPEDQAAAQRVQELLAQELTVDAAIQVALLENRTLQAVYEQLGIAQADLVQAGLLENPILAADVRFPTAEAAFVGAGMGLVQEFISILQIPLKKRVAEAAFEEAKLTASAAVIDLVLAVKRAFYRLQGAEQLLELRRTVVEASGLSADVARRQHEAGNITDLELANETALFEQARADLARTETEVAEDREELTALMGLWGTATRWRIAPRLPELPREAIAPEGLETRAVSQRLDLAAARQRIQGMLLSRDLTAWFRLIPTAGLGVAAEREVDNGVWSVGPAVELPLPIFDQGQAALANRSAQVRQRQHQHAALAVAIRSQVRRTWTRMEQARALAVHYWDVLLPLRVKVLQQTQLEYNAMLTGVFQLLTAKRDEIDAGRGYIEALRDYWIAHTDLESALGGELALAEPPPASPIPPAPGSDEHPQPHQHHHGG
jgi:cobalt-zinc-cadmium efflux system outer membrane protein